METPEQINKAPNSRLDDLDKRFKSSNENLSRECLAFALFINIIVPEGREKSLAFTKIEEVMFWADAGIDRN